MRRSMVAMAGLFIVLLASFVSVFCYLLMPDKSPDANEMHLSLSALSPGTSIRFIRIPASHASTNAGWFKSIFIGRESNYKSVPIDSLVVTGNEITYYEYTGGGQPMPASAKISSLMIADSDDLSNNSSGESFIKNQTFQKTYYLGADRFGRDVLSRLLAGTRVSMAVGLIAVLISLLVGIFLGSLAGFFRGKIDSVIMWIINVVWSVPTMLLVIAITLALGKGFVQVFIAVGLTMWVEVARMVRGQIFSIREMEFVEAGRALGFTDLRIITHHVLPNVMGPVVVIAASNFASAILLEAGLSFLGLGAQPPTPSWGMMIKESYAYIVLGAAHLAVFPGLAIMSLVLAFTWLGNGLRDALDPKSESGSKL